MTKNKVKLLALDLDGTVMRSDNTLAPEVKSAIVSAVSCGVEVVVASGRPFSTMPGEIMAIDGIRYVVASNGAAIYDASRRRVRSLTMRESDVLRLLELTEAHDLIWEAFCEGGICTDRRYYNDPVRYGCSAAYVDYVRSSRGCSDDMRGYIFVFFLELDSVEIVCADPSVREPLRAKLERELRGLYITSSSADFVEFMDSRATKSSAVRWICTRENISLAHTAEPLPFHSSQANGKPPMPSKRLAIVAFLAYCADILLQRNIQNGRAILLPNALYLAESEESCFLPLESIHSPMSVHPSGKP